MKSFKAFSIYALFMLLVSCGGGGATRGAAIATTTDKASSASSPVKYGYAVKRIYPHSTTSYTQGLVWHDGHLYEGTGMHGRSSLMKVELSTGKAVNVKRLSDDYFVEGIAVFNGKIYQLTWEEETMFVWDQSTMQKLSEVKYYGEGWGITNDSTHLYMSNGSDKIYVRDPETFAILCTIDVRMHGRPVHYLNELEWIEGEIWANVYTTNLIMRINPTTGEVAGIINLENILPQSDITPDTDVLNGIAYDSLNKRIFVTGKNWPKLFEIELIDNQ